MSFSLEIKKELAEIKNKKTCCRMSFALGIIADAMVIDEDVIELSVTSNETYDIISKAIQSVHKAPLDVSHEMRLGSDMYRIRFSDERFAELLAKLEKLDDPDDLFSESKCFEGNCKKCFLRGAFISQGTVSEPQKGYHLELKFKNAARAAYIYKMLTAEVTEPSIINRKSGNSIGLYYKNSTYIEDFLTYLGVVRGTFDFINVKIEREIRNAVNRGTNCVAGNIAKSVNAAQKQVSAIAMLEECGKLSMLPDELFETAKLRRDNPSMSLSELALRHDPPISKSGLTHRLAKIIEISEELK